MLVIVGIEVVYIEHQHAQWLAIEGATGAFALEDMFQPAAVIGAGKGVDIGGLFAVENDPVAFAHTVAEQFKHVLHQFWRLLEQIEQRFAVQAQHAAGLACHYIGGGVFIVDKADFAGAVADVQGADGLTVERAEVDLELTLEQQIEVLVAVEGREQNFAGFQIAGAELLEQLADAAGGDVIEQSQVAKLLQVSLPFGIFHGIGRCDCGLEMLVIANAPCIKGEYHA